MKGKYTEANRRAGGGSAFYLPGVGVLLPAQARALRRALAEIGWAVQLGLMSEKEARQFVLRAVRMAGPLDGY